MYNELHTAKSQPQYARDRGEPSRRILPKWHGKESEAGGFEPRPRTRGFEISCSLPASYTNYGLLGAANGKIGGAKFAGGKGGVVSHLPIPCQLYGKLRGDGSWKRGYFTVKLPCKRKERKMQARRILSTFAAALVWTRRVSWSLVRTARLAATQVLRGPGARNIPFLREQQYAY
jgi:hypothetical protein